MEIRYNDGTTNTQTRNNVEMWILTLTQPGIRPGTSDSATEVVVPSDQVISNTLEFFPLAFVAYQPETNLLVYLMLLQKPISAFKIPIPFQPINKHIVIRFPNFRLQIPFCWIFVCFFRLWWMTYAQCEVICIGLFVLPGYSCFTWIMASLLSCCLH